MRAAIVVRGARTHNLRSTPGTPMQVAAADTPTGRAFAGHVAAVVAGGR